MKVTTRDEGTATIVKLEGEMMLGYEANDFHQAINDAVDGNKKKIVGSLNQQIVFNRKKNPTYAKKMKCARNKAMKKLGDGKK